MILPLESFPLPQFSLLLLSSLLLLQRQRRQSSPQKSWIDPFRRVAHPLPSSPLPSPLPLDLPLDHPPPSLLLLLSFPSLPHSFLLSLHSLQHFQSTE